MITDPQRLDRVLLVARHRAFWTTEHAHALFPHRVMLPSYVSMFTYAIHLPRILLKILVMRPRLLVLGTTMPYAKLYAMGKRLGLFTRLPCVTDHQFLSSKDAKEFAAIWVYSSHEVLLQEPAVRSRFVVFRYPAKTALVGSVPRQSGRYVFAGGNHKRDFNAFIAAMRNLSIPAVLVTDRQLPEELPSHIEAHGRVPLEEYIKLMGEALFVVVPLEASKIPHGHCDISIGVSLGKAIITTREAGVDEYVDEGRSGLLVDPGDIEGYRTAIHRMAKDDAFRRACETRARELAPEFSYERFAERLYALCAAVIG